MASYVRTTAKVISSVASSRDVNRAMHNGLAGPYPVEDGHVMSEVHFLRSTF